MVQLTYSFANCYVHPLFIVRRVSFSPTLACWRLRRFAYSLRYDQFLQFRERDRLADRIVPYSKIYVFFCFVLNCLCRPHIVLCRNLLLTEWKYPKRARRGSYFYYHGKRYRRVCFLCLVNLVITPTRTLVFINFVAL